MWAKSIHIKLNFEPYYVKKMIMFFLFYAGRAALLFVCAYLQHMINNIKGLLIINR